jgi:predicted N-acyltransferase
MEDLYFNPNYAKLYKNIDGESDTFVFECPYGTITNIFILRKVKWQINGQTYFDIVTPYGFGGPLAQNVKDIEKLLVAYKKAFTEYCLEHNIICEFIRYHLYDNVNVREHYYGETLHLLDNVVVDTTGDYETKIWRSYEHKVRKNVNKAVKNGLEIVIENKLDYLDCFLSIYNDTMDRNNADDYYYFKREYFEDIAHLLPSNFMYFHVFKDGKMASTELVLCSEDYAYSLLGGTNTEYYEFRPNDFLKNEIIKWCNQTGRKKFILGGGYHKDDGIYKYKRCFTPDPDVPFYVGRYIFNKAVYDKAIEARNTENESFTGDTGYFPKYRQ